jgi:hypothetical protein
MYIHWESIDNPVDFAIKTLESIEFLGSPESEEGEVAVNGDLGDCANNLPIF